MATQQLDLFVEDTGEAGLPTLLCLHSLFLDGRMFDGLAAAAAGTFRVVRPDFRGQGRSAPADGKIVDMETCADDIEAVLDHLALDRVSVVAQSMGGDVAIRLAARRPDAIAAMVLLGSSARDEPQENLDAFRPIADEVAKHGFAGELYETTMQIMFGATTRANPERADIVEHWGQQIAALPPALAPAIRGVVERPSVVGLLPAIDVPVLVVSGEEDIARPPAWADEVVAGLPRAELLRLPGIGHSPILEAPETVVPRVLGFLAAV
ncbi:MAG: alpha/beta hydrolase [Solirubrobacteraceae bacterium]|nr:alpha/beta hydrolase [Solirubrobacteraceae bacterium]